MAALELTGGFLLGGLLVLAAFFFVVIFNGLIAMRNNVDKAWANIDVLLKKRLDLIPALVEVVQGYTTYERGVLEDITRIRVSALQAAGVPEKAQGNEAISASLKTIFLLAENYPDLKASGNFLNLQEELSSIEGQIARRREFYNDSVLLYNTRIKTIPGVFVADLIRCKPREYFKVGEEAEKPIEVAIGNR
ncbi:MAG TPA: LemA family protein [Methanomicrobiales archaeon]|nr:LemA family protein [Methanomicrobiales archaeon]